MILLLDTVPVCLQGPEGKTGEVGHSHFPGVLVLQDVPQAHELGVVVVSMVVSMVVLVVVVVVVMGGGAVLPSIRGCYKIWVTWICPHISDV